MIVGLCIFFISLFTIVLWIKFIITKKIISVYTDRISTIDGLRGYLAIGVFFTHYIINYNWHITGLWEITQQNWINNISENSVYFFFIITGYLFSNKILNNNFQIKVFLVNRFFRLAPLYYSIVFLMVFVVFLKTGFQLNEPLYYLFIRVFKWILFLQSNLNGFSNTSVIVAGVTWTLMYEWIFYFSLPVFLYLLRKNKLILLIFISIILFLSFFNFHLNIFHLSVKMELFVLFFIGFLVAKIRNIIKNNKFYFNNISFSIINFITLYILITQFDTSLSVLQYILLFFCFCTIVLGNSFFGILNLIFSRFLGEISYSIYLVHGVVMYIIFSILFPDFIIKNSLTTYLYMFPLILLIVIIISTIKYKYIEYPMVIFGKRIIEKYD